MDKSNAVSAAFVGSIPKGYKPWVDELRGIAAILVLFSHFYWTPYAFQQGIIHYLISPGEFGVALFFCISGFVIPLSVDSSKEDVATKFIVHRLFRLYPIYWISVLFMAAISGPPMTQLFQNFTMAQRYLGGSDILAVSWTLQVELAFYFIAFSLLIIKGVFSRYLLFVGFFAISAGCIIIRLVEWFTGIHAPVGLSDGLFIMLFSWIIFFRPSEISRIQRILISITFIIVEISWLFDGFREAGNVISPGSVGKLISYNLAILVFFGALRFRGSIDKGSKTLIYLGSISYSLYLLHMPIYSLITSGDISRFGPVLTPLLAAGASIILSMISYRWIERPAIRIGKSLATRMTRSSNLSVS